MLDNFGRGYTDLCAALVAVSLKAQELQVWKEVDGIYTADPSKVPTARLISEMTPSEGDYYPNGRLAKLLISNKLPSLRSMDQKYSILACLSAP